MPPEADLGSLSELQVEWIGLVTETSADRIEGRCNTDGIGDPLFSRWGQLDRVLGGE